MRVEFDASYIEEGLIKYINIGIELKLSKVEAEPPIIQVIGKAGSGKSLFVRHVLVPLIYKKCNVDCHVIERADIVEYTGYLKALISLLSIDRIPIILVVQRDIKHLKSSRIIVNGLTTVKINEGDLI